MHLVACVIHVLVALVTPVATMNLTAP